MSEKMSFYAINTSDEAAMLNAKEAAVQIDYKSGLKKAKKAVEKLQESEHFRRPEGTPEEMLDAAEKYMDGEYTFACRKVAKGLDETSRKLFNTDRRTYDKLLEVWKTTMEGSHGRKLPSAFLAEVRGVLEAKNGDPASAGLRNEIAKAFNGERTPEESLVRRMQFSSRGIINYQLRRVYGELEAKGIISKEEWGARFEGVTKKDQLAAMLKDSRVSAQAYETLISVLGGEGGLLKYAQTNTYLKTALEVLREDLDLDESFKLKVKESVRQNTEAWRGVNDEVLRKSAVEEVALKSLEALTKHENVPPEQQKLHSMLVKVALESFLTNRNMKRNAIETYDASADRQLGEIIAFISRVSDALGSSEPRIESLDSLLEELANETERIKVLSASARGHNNELIEPVNILVAKNQYLKLVALAMDGFRNMQNDRSSASYQLSERYLKFSHNFQARCYRMVLITDARSQDVDSAVRNEEGEEEFTKGVIAGVGSFAMAFAEPFHQGDFRYNSYRAGIIRQGYRRSLAAVFPGMEGVMDVSEDYNETNNFLNRFLGVPGAEAVYFARNRLGRFWNEVDKIRWGLGTRSLSEYTGYIGDMQEVMEQQRELAVQRSSYETTLSTLRFVSNDFSEVAAFLKRERLTEEQFRQGSAVSAEIRSLGERVETLRSQLKGLGEKKLGALESARLSLARRLGDTQTEAKLTDAAAKRDAAAAIERIQARIKELEDALETGWRYHQQELEKERREVVAASDANGKSLKWGDVISLVKNGVPGLLEDPSRNVAVLDDGGDFVGTRGFIGYYETLSEQMSLSGAISAVQARISGIENQVRPLREKEFEIRQTADEVRRDTGLAISLSER